MRRHFGRSKEPRVHPLFPPEDNASDDGVTSERIDGARRVHLSTSAIRVVCYTLLFGYVATLIIAFPDRADALIQLLPQKAIEIGNIIAQWTTLRDSIHDWY